MNILLCFLCGSITVLSFAPYHIFILPFVTISTLLHFINKASNYRQAFWYGWSFGFGLFGFGLYWISNALLTDSSQFWWLLPFATLGIPAILAIYIGLFAISFFYIKKKNLFFVVVSSAALWTLIEIARAKLFTGFPWLLLGYSAGASLEYAQISYYVTVFGLSFLLFVTYSMPYVVYRRPKNLYIFLTINIFINLLVYCYGFNALRQEVQYKKASVRLLQPNILKFRNFSSMYQAKSFFTLMKLSKESLSPDLNYIIWPELPLPLSLFKSEYLDVLSQILPADINFISNSIRYDSQKKRLYNSSIIFQNKKIIGFYDKHHLVPFGEYVPFKNILKFSKITDGFVDFAPGSGHKNININDDNFNILICYESFFPKDVFKKKPGFIVNITNDAWYGNTQGPHLHLEMTRFRAIEERVQLFRAANNGISACIDPYGRYTKLLKLYEKGYIDCKIATTHLH